MVRRSAIAASLAAAVVVLGACAALTPEPAPAWEQPDCAATLGQDGHDLAFEELVRDWSSADFEEMRVYLLRSADDMAQLDGMLRSYYLEPLLAVDYRQYVVVAVFDGIKGNLCPGTAVQRVRHVGDTLVVCADHWGRPPDRECETMMGNPLDIVAVSRGEEDLDDVRVMLCTQTVPYPTLTPR